MSDRYIKDLENQAHKILAENIELKNKVSRLKKILSKLLEQGEFYYSAIELDPDKYDFDGHDFADLIEKGLEL